ncbi:MAG: antibiotic biosynthesis monooxygenase [Cyanobacteria bacterium J06621_12]
MILEVAILKIKPGMNQQFETAFAEAAKIISAMDGYLNHDLQKCLETENQYLLLVNWKTLADHTVGFRGSAEYQTWKKLLHHFYEPFPVVEHYQTVIQN